MTNIDSGCAYWADPAAPPSHLSMLTPCQTCFAQLCLCARSWETGYNSFEWDLTKYPNSSYMIDTLHARGSRVTLWITSFINPESSNYDEVPRAPAADVGCAFGSQPLTMLVGPTLHRRSRRATSSTTANSSTVREPPTCRREAACAELTARSFASVSVRSPWPHRVARHRLAL